MFRLMEVYFERYIVLEIEDGLNNISRHSNHDIPVVQTMKLKSTPTCRRQGVAWRYPPTHRSGLTSAARL